MGDGVRPEALIRDVGERRNGGENSTRVIDCGKNGARAHRDECANVDMERTVVGDSDEEEEEGEKVSGASLDGFLLPRAL